MKRKKYGNPVKQKMYEEQRKGRRVKELGQVYTPTALVQEMLDKLPSNSFKLGKTAIDPSCGNGQFLAEVYQRKLNSGISPLATLITTFGVELDKSEARKCRNRLYDILMDTEIGRMHSIAIRQLLKATIRCADSLKSDLTDIKFWVAPLSREMQEYYISIYKAVTEDKINIEIVPQLIDYNGRIAYTYLAA